MTDRSLVVKRGKRKMGLFSSFFSSEDFGGFMAAAAAASLSSPEPKKKRKIWLEVKVPQSPRRTRVTHK